MTRTANTRMLLGKVESTRGTAIAMTAADAILVTGDPDFVPFAGDSVDRELWQDGYGGSPEIPVGTHQTLAFSVEIAGTNGAPAAAKLPGWAKLLRACGMKQTIVAAGAGNGMPNDVAGVQFDPHSQKDVNVGAAPNAAVDAGYYNDSLTLRFFYGGVLHQLVGCRGAWSLQFEADQTPKIRFEFTGTYANPTDTASPAGASYPDFIAPTVVSYDGTTTFSLFGIATLPLSSLSIESGNAVTFRNLPNYADQVLIAGRDVTGTIRADAETVATFDPFSKAKSATTGALELVHGPDSAGKRFRVAASKVQITRPGYETDETILQHGLPIKLLPPGTDNDLSIQVY